jgi:hypothetical protein
VTSRALVVLAALAVAACSESPQPVSAAVRAPSAIVAFSGETARRPGVQAYLAVASGRANEVRLVDPLEDRPVLGPTLLFPLSISTDPRPLRLAAAPLGDGQGDLLAVAAPGGLDGPSVELVVTWDPQNRALAPIPLSDAATGVPDGAEVLALAAGPAPGAGVDGAPARALLVAGLATSTASWLAVLEFGRVGEAVVHQRTVVKPLAGAAGPIRPADLAFSPDGRRLFVATSDPLAPGVHGVAQLELAALSVDPAVAWPLTPLDARAPTRLVAAADVVERSVVADGAPVVGRDDFGAGVPAPRVYAALDPDGPAGCGPLGAIRCGIATLVPFDAAVPGSGGLAPDPSRLIADLDPATAGQGLPYRAPIEVAGVPLDIAPSLAAAQLATSSPCDPNGPARLELVAANDADARCTSAVAAVPSSDGNVYLVDLGRFHVPSRVPVVSGETRTRVGAATAAGLTLAGAGGLPVPIDSLLPAAIQVTPGVTPTDAWRVEQQGVLPGLQTVRGVALKQAGAVRVAAQSNSNRGTGEVVEWIVDPPIASPALGVQAGDLVQLELTSTAIPVCAEGAEAVVEAVLPPDAAFPGGALQLPTQVPAASGGSLATCADALPEGVVVSVTLTVRSGGLLLSSTRLGHLGRPALGVRYALEWTALADPDAAAAPATVAQALARRARRFYYPADEVCAADGCAGFPGLAHPLAPGPMLAFTAALDPDPDDDPATPPPEALARGARLSFVTTAGYDPAVRRPSGAVMPIGAAAVDRSRLTGLAGSTEVRYYVPHSDDQILTFGPGEAGASVIR